MLGFSCFIGASGLHTDFGYILLFTFIHTFNHCSYWNRAFSKFVLQSRNILIVNERSIQAYKIIVLKHRTMKWLIFEQKLCHEYIEHECCLQCYVKIVYKLWK